MRIEKLEKLICIEKFEISKFSAKYTKKESITAMKLNIIDNAVKLKLKIPTIHGKRRMIMASKRIFCM